MKRLTGSSLKQTRKIIILMLTITVAVGLLPLVSITVDAANAAYEYPYIIAVNDEVYVSNGIFILTARYENPKEITSYFYGLWSIGDTVLKLVYSPVLNDWTTELVIQPQESETFYRFGTADRYITDFVVVTGSPQFDPDVFWASKSIITNVPWNEYEKAILGSYSNDLTQLPKGLTENDIQTIINQQLNTQTDAGEMAETLNTRTQEVYADYQNGDRTREEMQLLLEVYAETLNDLTPSTLLDAMQINNALTYNQTIQQIITSTSSTTVQEVILEYLEPAILAYFSWQQGELSLSDTMVIIEENSRGMAGCLIDGTAKTTADISAVNVALEYMQTLTESISGSQDIEKWISTELQESDNNELVYLEQLIIDTYNTNVSDIAPSKNFTYTQKDDVEELLDVIWENEFIKRLVPLCAGFMVVCVALGVKYKV